MLSTYVIYNFILITCFFFSIFYSKKKSPYNYFIILSIFLTLFIPSSIRYGIGTDYFSYLGILEHARLGSITTEFGYYLINLFVITFDLNSQFIFVISGFLIYINIIISILMLNKKYFPVTIFVLVCSFYLLSYSLLRQAIAISFITLAISFFISRRFILFGLFTLIGSSFHLSVLFIIAFPILTVIEIRRNALIAVTLFLSIMIIKTDVLTLLMNSNLFSMTKYGYYIHTEFGGAAKINTGIGVLIKCIIPILVVIYSDKVVSLNKNYSILVYLSVGSILANAASTQIYIFNRLSDVFSFLSFLSVPILLSSITNRLQRKLIIALIVILFISFYERTIFANLSSTHSGLGISPYVTIFDR